MTTVTNKNGIEFDIDAIATDLNGKADTDLTNVSNTAGFRRLIEIYNNGMSWYKVFSEYNPSNGNYIGKWCEQGGYYVPTSSAYEYTISLLKPYANTNYCIYLTGQGIDDHDYYRDAYSVFYKNKTVNSFKAAHDVYSTEPCYWRTCGYIR